MVIPFRPQASPEGIQVQVDRVLPASEAQLNERGCSASLFRNLTRTARHRIAWLARNESDVATLDLRGVDGFLRHDCDCPAVFRSRLDVCSRWHAHRVLGYLVETGQAAVPSAIVTGGRLVEAFAGALAAPGYRESTVLRDRTFWRHCIVWL